LMVGLLNYLPTRLAPAALLLGLGCAGQMVILFGGRIPGLGSELLQGLSAMCLAASPWTAWVGLARPYPPRSEFDRMWLDFRNRYGLVWGQRVREQFNRSAINAGW